MVPAIDGIFLCSQHVPLIGYADVHCDGSAEDRRSFTGYLLMMNVGVIVWDTKKQTTVTLFITESGYMAMNKAAKEAVHLRFLREPRMHNIERKC